MYSIFLSFIYVYQKKITLFFCKILKPFMNFTRIYKNTDKRRWIHLRKKLFIGMVVGTAVLAAACSDTATVKENTTATSDLTLK